MFSLLFFHQKRKQLPSSVIVFWGFRYNVITTACNLQPLVITTAGNLQPLVITTAGNLQPVVITTAGNLLFAVKPDEFQQKWITDGGNYHRR